MEQGRERCKQFRRVGFSVTEGVFGSVRRVRVASGCFYPTDGAAAPVCHTEAPVGWFSWGQVEEVNRSFPCLTPSVAKVDDSPLICAIFGCIQQDGSRSRCL